MKEYHLHPDENFIIRENNKLVAILESDEIAQFAEISLPAGCTEILVAADGIIYATVNKAMEGINHNPLEALIAQEAEIIAFHQAKLVARAAASNPIPEPEAPAPEPEPEIEPEIPEEPESEPEQ